MVSAIVPTQHDAYLQNYRFIYPDTAAASGITRVSSVLPFLCEIVCKQAQLCCRLKVKGRNMKQSKRFGRKMPTMRGKQK